MADPNTRQGKRTPVTLKIKFKSETLEQFIERYAVDVSQGGIFIRTKEPLAVGTAMKFEFQLRDASPLIGGEGTVVWTRENDPSRPAIAPGMGVRFDRLAEGSQAVLERILAEKAKQAPHRATGESPTKPPMFTDTPTRVAPAPIKDALLGADDRSGGNRARSTSHTPLPKPMPFHSDADEFPEEAFEEATKVRALDELVAQTAAHEGLTRVDSLSPDEIARRGGRADSTLSDPPAPSPSTSANVIRSKPDRDSAPVLPSPPEPSRPTKLLDTTPSPRTASSTEPPRGHSPSAQPGNDLAGRTRLGIEPAKAPTREPTGGAGSSPSASAGPTGPTSAFAGPTSGSPRAIPVDAMHPPAPSQPSRAPIWIGMLVFVAVALAGVWYFVLRDTVSDSVAKNGSGGSNAVATGSDHGSGGGSDVATGSDHGSGGTTVAANDSDHGSNGSAGSDSAIHGPTVDTLIASSVAKATVQVVGTDQTGPAPFTAKLEKDKAYKVHVTAPGFTALDLDVKGGADKVTAKLVAKPHVVTVTSDPPGAAIFIDGAPTGKVTPFDVELTAAQAARPRIHVLVRKVGYRQNDQIVDAASFVDEDARLIGKADSKLPVQIQIATPPGGNGGTHPTGAGSGSGSAAGAGSGSAATPTGTGSGSATEGGGDKSGGDKGGGDKGGGDKGSASAPPKDPTPTKPPGDEPAPDWSKP